MGVCWFEGSLKDVEIDCSILSAVFKIAESKIYEKYFVFFHYHVWCCQITVDYAVLVYFQYHLTHID